MPWMMGSIAAMRAVLEGVRGASTRLATMEAPTAKLASRTSQPPFTVPAALPTQK